MTPDGHPATPAGLHPETAVICAGRPAHAARGPHQNSNHSVRKAFGLLPNPQVTGYTQWGERGDSNPRHPGPQPGALTN